jgi:hypothetical protein
LLHDQQQVLLQRYFQWQLVQHCYFGKKFSG